MKPLKPARHYENPRMIGGRFSPDLNGCKTHTNMCDYVKWPDGTIECAACARDRQPYGAYIWDWVK